MKRTCIWGEQRLAGADRADGAGSVRVIRASPRVLRVISLLGLENVFVLGRGPVLADVIEPLTVGLGAALNLQVTVAEPTGMEDDMSDEQYGSPRSGRLSPAEGRPDAPTV